MTTTTVTTKAHKPGLDPSVIGHPNVTLALPRRDARANERDIPLREDVTSRHAHPATPRDERHGLSRCVTLTGVVAIRLVETAPHTHISPLKNPTLETSGQRQTLPARTLRNTPS